MKNTELVRELESALSASMRELLSTKFGLSADVIGHIVTGAASVVAAAVMTAGSNVRGAQQVLTAVMADANDARLVERLEDRISTTAGLRELEVIGQTFALACLTTSMSELGDCVADHVGVPVQPAYALTAAIAAILGGFLKYYMLVEQATPGDLTQLLANQWPVIEPYLTDRRAAALRLDGVAAFRDAIPAQLRVLAGSQQRETDRATSPAPAPTPVENEIVQHVSTVALMEDGAGRAVLQWLVALACLVTAAGLAAAVLLMVFLQSHPAWLHNVASVAAEALHRIKFGLNR